MVKNSNWKDWVMGTTFVTNNIWTITLFNETKGIPVGVVHFNTNLTIKTDGDFVNEVSNMKVECY